MKSEAAILNDLRLEASEKGARLWRNNVGATMTNTGSYIRFGLANDSMAVNQAIKSADLIGIKPIIITEEHIGKQLGVFLSREVKKPGWQYTGNARDRAQLAWIDLINFLGGDARFVTGRGEL